jgi:hypothetical protein
MNNFTFNGIFQFHRCLRQPEMLVNISILIIDEYKFRTDICPEQSPPAHRSWSAPDVSKYLIWIGSDKTDPTPLQEYVEAPSASLEIHPELDSPIRCD